jgi:shikimate dehydrogenase
MAHGEQRTTRRAAVIGWPVSHSLSPLIHSIWAAREGIDASYEAIAVEPDDKAFRERIEFLRADGYRGVNVTLPHKKRALKIADRASDAAAKIGAANMLTFSDDGVVAANSDAMAVGRIVLDLSKKPSSALILGAGGAARAVLWALTKRTDPPKVFLTNRTRARAEEMAPLGSASVVDWDARNEVLRATDLVINTTSLGMTGQPPLELDYANLKDSAAVFDIVYSPLETPLLRAAKARGLMTADGLEMLMQQAVPGYLAWLGSKAEIDADLRDRLEAALKARRS